MIWILRVFKQKKGALAVTCLLIFLQTLGMLAVPTLTANIINLGVAAGDIDYILKTGILMVAVAVVSALCAVAAAYLSSSLAAFAGRELRVELFAKAQQLSLEEFDSIGSSSMITRSTGDIVQIQQAVLFILQFLLPVPLMTLSGLLLGLARDRVLTALLVGLMGIYIVYGYLIGRQMVPITRQMQTKMDAINRTLLQRLSGVRVIRAFNRSSYEQQKLTAVATQYADTAIALNKVYAVTYGFIMLTMNMVIVLFLWLGGARITIGAAKVGDIMAFIEYATLILSTLNMGIMTVIYMFRASACVERVRGVLTVNLHPQHQPNTATGLGTTAQSLVLEDVTFGYDGAQEPVIKQISFTALRGQTTAIIGSTGSGKSTILKLIAGFYTPQSGSIAINDVDIATISEEQLRARLGVVPQKAFLFSGTVEENIRYGKNDADSDEVVTAAKVAQTHEFIEAMPEGYKTVVTQEGGNLSGGQKQRIAIARAVVRQPQIYLLDDCYSALDLRTGSLLQAALKQQAADSIVLVVAQRIQSVQEAEQIIVLDKGEVAGKGTHQELLQRCEVYRQIAESQREMEG